MARLQYPLALAAAGTNDVSRLDENTPAEVIAVPADEAAAEQQLVALVRRAAAQGQHLAVSGGRHSMGGHTLYPGGIVLDMLPFRHLELDEKARLLTAGAGARWSDILPYLDHHGLSVQVMQAYDDFTVGGSLSVNCHGWQNDLPPVASTVESFRLLKADGEVVRCSRTENPELFSLALGGYGLFGIDSRRHPAGGAERELRRRGPPGETGGLRSGVPPADRRPRRHRARLWPDQRRPPPFPRRRNPHRDAARAPRGHRDRHPALGKTAAAQKAGLPRQRRQRLRQEPALVAGDDDRGKGRPGAFRNQLLHEPSALYANRDSALTEVLHEYSIPADRLGEFLAEARLDLPAARAGSPQHHGAQRDDGSGHRSPLRPPGSLRPGPAFRPAASAEAEAAMQALTRDLIDVALDCGGRYYLPHRPHATADQFRRSYPEAEAFFARKRHYDPSGIFSNRFYLNYGKSFEPAAGEAPN